MKYNFIIGCTAEEEIAGTNGIKSILKKLPKIDLELLESQLMKLSIAERGPIVFDAKIKGKPSHAATKITIMPLKNYQKYSTGLIN